MRCARGKLPPRFALHFLLELIALRFLFDETWTVAELCLPLTAPRGTNTIFALYLSLELSAFGLDLDFAGTAPEVFPHFPAPPAFAIARAHVVICEGCGLDEQEQCCKEAKASCAWPAWQRPTRSAADTNARYRPRPSLSFPIVDRPSDAKAGRIVPTAAARLICARLGLMCVSSVSVCLEALSRYPGAIPLTAQASAA